MFAPFGGVNTKSIIGDAMGLRYRSQMRAARALLSWSQDKLAAQSGISSATIKRIEPGDGPLPTTVETLVSLERALEAAGVIFIDENGQGPGVRLRKEAVGE